MFLIFRQKSNTIYKLIFCRLLENFYRLNGFYLSDTKIRVSLLSFSVTEIIVQAGPFKHFIFGSNLVDFHYAFLNCFVLVPYTFPNIKSRPQCGIGRIVFFLNYITVCSEVSGRFTALTPVVGGARRRKNNHLKPVNSVHALFGRLKYPTFWTDSQRPRMRPGIRLDDVFMCFKITAGTNKVRAYYENGTQWSFTSLLDAFVCFVKS